MAVQDKYINANVVAGKLANAALISGSRMICQVSTFETAVADDDGSVYRIAKALQPNLIPVLILVNNDAISAGSDYDLGLYLTDLGAVVDADVFADGVSMTGARITGSHISGLSNVDVANMTKKLYEHAGHDVTNSKDGYDLAWTANTVGSAIGTITTVFIAVEG